MMSRRFDSDIPRRHYGEIRCYDSDFSSTCGNSGRSDDEYTRWRLGNRSTRCRRVRHRDNDSEWGWGREGRIHRDDDYVHRRWSPLDGLTNRFDGLGLGNGGRYGNGLHGGMHWPPNSPYLGGGCRVFVNDDDFPPLLRPRYGFRDGLGSPGPYMSGAQGSPYSSENSFDMYRMDRGRMPYGPYGGYRHYMNYRPPFWEDGSMSEMELAALSDEDYVLRPEAEYYERRGGAGLGLGPHYGGYGLEGRLRRGML